MTGRCRNLVRMLVRILMTTAIMALLVSPVAAKNVQSRVRFYGWVEAMPDGLLGTWRVGGQTVTTGPETEFDQTEGALVVGGCAKVDMRNGIVHEIDSELASDCQ